MSANLDYSKLRFLIVDDEPFMLGMLERALRSLKAKPTATANSGLSALKSFTDDGDQVDCIISDCDMQRGSGLQLLQAVRAGVNPHIPRDQRFIMLTSQIGTDVMNTATKLDVNAYLTKPVSPAKLSEALQQIFRTPTDLKIAEYYHSIDVGPLLDLAGDGEDTA